MKNPGKEVVGGREMNLWRAKTQGKKKDERKKTSKGGRRMVFKWGWGKQKRLQKRGKLKKPDRLGGSTVRILFECASGGGGDKKNCGNVEIRRKTCRIDVE